jgi:long-subunit fatty acid transport protein
MKRNNKVLPYLIMLACSSAIAQERLDIPSSFNPVGSGARAMGMGGSFIAMADDATAASWNPSALIQLRKAEVALVYSHTSLDEDLIFSEQAQANGEQTASSHDLNYLAFSAPCSADTCGKNMVFSINYQRLYDLSRNWNIAFNEPTENNDIDFRFKQQGGLYAIGAAYAVQITDDLTLGVTFNFWDDFQSSNEWHSDYLETVQSFGEIALTNTSMIDDSYDFSGQNINVGLLWNVFQKNESKLVLGVVYKTEMDADLRKPTSFSTVQVVPEFPDFNSSFSGGPDATDFTLTMPSSLGVGLAYQWSDKLTTSIDIYKTDWSSFKLTDDSGASFSPLSLKSSDTVTIKDTVQIRVGGEYRIICQDMGVNYIIPIRAGFFIDPAAADNASENTYGVSVGTGIAYDTWVFDVAYQYRWGTDLGKSYLQDLGFSYDLTEHQLFGSAFYRF